MKTFARNDFRKSSFSEPDRDCVEVAQRPDLVEMRDSKTTFGSAADGRVRVNQATFAEFLTAVSRRRSPVV